MIVPVWLVDCKYIDLILVRGRLLRVNGVSHALGSEHFFVVAIASDDAQRLDEPLGPMHLTVDVAVSL